MPFTRKKWPEEVVDFHANNSLYFSYIQDFHPSSQAYFELNFRNRLRYRFRVNCLIMNYLKGVESRSIFPDYAP